MEVQRYSVHALNTVMLYIYIEIHNVRSLLRTANCYVYVHMYKVHAYVREW